jgi:predicted phage terminase large subunit-like protein
LYGNPVAWYAGTVQTFADVWREIYDAVAPVRTYANKQEKVIHLRGGGKIDFWTLHNGADSMAGRGRKYACLGIDEAAFVKGLKDIWDQAIRPTLMDYRGIAYIYSTPKGALNDFADFFQRGLSDKPEDREWSSWQVSSHDNPFMPRSELEDMERSYVGRELAYRQEIMAEFVEDAGLVFQAGWLRQRTAPKFTTVYQAWDTAMTEKTVDKPSPDASVGVCGAKDTAGRIWLLDLVKGHWGTPELVEQILRFQNKWNKDGVYCREVYIEGGPAGKSCAQVLESRRREAHQEFRVKTVPSTKDKITRAAPMASHMARGNYVITDKAPWFEDFKRELMSFPGGRHDDQVDAASLLCGQEMNMRMSDTAYTLDGRDPDKIYHDVRQKEIREARERASGRTGWGSAKGAW